MNEMKPFLFGVCILASTIQIANPDVSVSGTYAARSYVLIDGYSGEILEGKDYHLVRSVASISKLMTAVLALEAEEALFYSYTISEASVGIEGSSIYLQAGDSYRLVDLVYGLLLRSGNDAAYAISTIVCDTTEEFVARMNEKASEIGMEHTIFHNPCGLDIDDEGNLSTSYDMAVLMRYCMENALFSEIISTRSYRFGTHVYENKNKLLKSYDCLIGGKTGFTTKARRTLVTAAQKEDQYLIMVTLDCGSDYAFHRAIYEAYFEKYTYVVFLTKGRNYIDEYIFDVSRTIGMRIDKSVSLRGIKQYFVHPLTRTLEISLILEDGKEYKGGTYEDIEVSSAAKE